MQLAVMPTRLYTKATITSYSCSPINAWASVRGTELFGIKFIITIVLLRAHNYVILQFCSHLLQT